MDVSSTFCAIVGRVSECGQAASGSAERWRLGKTGLEVSALGRVAAQKGVSIAQIAIAWVMAQGDGIVPLIGARTRVRLNAALGAVNIVLTPDDLAAIERAVPKNAVAGRATRRH